MNRRTPILVCGLIAASAALSSCSTFDTSTVATVNGAKIDKSVIEMLSADNGDPSSGNANIAALNGASLRRAITNMVQARLAEQVADQFGIDLAASRKNLGDSFVQGLGGKQLELWKTLSDDERELVIDAQAAPAAMRNTPGSAPADLEQRYTDPERTGYFCIRFMAFQSADIANATYDDLVKGADFGTLANNFDPSARGGVVAGPDGSECVSIDNFRPPSTPQPLADALFSGTPGVVIPPVHVVTSEGEAWFVLLHRPWGEISSALTKSVAASPSFAEFLAQLSRARVAVDDRYGVWDPVAAGIATHP